MKKLKELKENECIRISSKRDAKGLAKQLNKQGFAKLNNSKFKAKWLFDSTHVYLGRKFDRFDLFEDASNVVYPASDFIRPSVKERLRHISDRVGKLESNPLLSQKTASTIPSLYDAKIVNLNASDMTVNEHEELYSIQDECRRELTELPEKWAVKHSPDTLKWIQQNAEINGIAIQGDPYYWFPNDFSRNNCGVEVPEDYTEITFEQFEKWVLNVPSAYKQGWYKNHGAMVYIDGKKIIYGFDVSVNWRKEDNMPDGAEVEATHAEVEAALIGEAKRRGFKTGRVVTTENTFNFYGEFKYYPENNTLYLGSGRIFNNGNWEFEVIEAAEQNIDWSVPGQLLTTKEGCLCISLSDINENKFQGYFLTEKLYPNFMKGVIGEYLKVDFKRYAK